MRAHCTRPRGLQRTALLCMVAALTGMVGAIAMPVFAGTHFAEGPPGKTASHAACHGCLRIETDHINSPRQARKAFHHAELIWASRLLSRVPIRIRVSFRSLKAKASTIPNPVRGFKGAVDETTWYPTALANAIVGEDQDTDGYDMEIFFSDWIEWYYGTDGKVPKNQVDFVSVALHEIAHGLGFTSRLSLGKSRTFPGLKPGKRFPDLSFVVPDLQRMPTIFDRFIETGDGQRLMEIKEHGEKSVKLGHAVMKGRLYFGGEKAITENDGERPRLHAVNPSHVNQMKYEWSRNGLMTAKALKGRAIHEPGPIVMGVLQDLGWELLEAPAATDMAVQPPSPQAEP
jgi:hypothetical protein